MSRIDESRPFVPVRIAVLTVSDTRTFEDDKSGNTLVEQLEKAGHTLADRAIVTDDIQRIQDKVRGWTENSDIDVVITTGGTGFTGRDVTPDALEPLFESAWTGFQKSFTASALTRSARPPSSPAPRAES